MGADAGCILKSSLEWGDRVRGNGHEKWTLTSFEKSGRIPSGYSVFERKLAWKNESMQRCGCIHVRKAAENVGRRSLENAERISGFVLYQTLCFCGMAEKALKNDIDFLSELHIM